MEQRQTLCENNYFKRLNYNQRRERPKTVFNREGTNESEDIYVID